MKLHEITPLVNIMQNNQAVSYRTKVATTVVLSVALSSIFFRSHEPKITQYNQANNPVSVNFLEAKQASSITPNYVLVSNEEQKQSLQNKNIATNEPTSNKDENKTNPLEVFGVIASLISVCTFIPQTIKTLRSKSTRDISLPTYSMLVAGIVSWGLYGVGIGKLPLIITNSINVVFTLPVLIMKIKNRKKDQLEMAELEEKSR